MVNKFAVFTALLLSINMSFADQNFEPAEQAFPFNAHIEKKNNHYQIHATWGADEGYHLYHDKFLFASEGSVLLGSPIIPAGEIVDNKELNTKREEHTGIVDIIIPIEKYQSKDFKLVAVAQGCAQTLCYPPQKRVVSLSIQ